MGANHPSKIEFLIKNRNFAQTKSPKTWQMPRFRGNVTSLPMGDGWWWVMAPFRPLFYPRKCNFSVSVTSQKSSFFGHPVPFL
jgi:hypothetical protein